MKLVIRALVFGVAVSGLAASALTAHVEKNQTAVDAHVSAMASQQVVGAMPMPVCLPGGCNSIK